MLTYLVRIRYDGKRAFALREPRFQVPGIFPNDTRGRPAPVAPSRPLMISPMIDVLKHRSRFRVSAADTLHLDERYFLDTLL